MVSPINNLEHHGSKMFDKCLLNVDGMNTSQRITHSVIGSENLVVSLTSWPNFSSDIALMDEIFGGSVAEYHDHGKICMCQTYPSSIYESRKS